MKKTASAIALMTFSSLANALPGQVTDQAGNPVNGAMIRIEGTQIEARTDAQGRFELNVNDLADGDIHVNAPGYTHRTIQLDADSTSSLNIILRRSPIEQIDVTATPLGSSIMESSQPVTVVAGDNLRRRQASTLGETLKNEVGVHSSYFGPVASSPVIRGFNGPRVLIVQNGLDVSDASRVGPDHVVATETTTARQVEVLRGPATLTYGSGAIGGVVNIVDNRVPTDNLSEGSFLLEHDTVNNGDQANFSFQTGTDRLAFHVDGFWREGDNYDIPGRAEIEIEDDHDHDHEEDEHDHEDEEHDETHSEGVLANSASESAGFNLGSSFLLDNGYVGFSYGRLERTNGIPGHSHDHGHDHEEGEHDHEAEAHEHEAHEDGVVSDLQQDRWQLISELNVDNQWLSGVHTRLGYTDYEHVEIENNLAGTQFLNKTIQARVDLLLNEFNGWRGALSFESKSTDFEAVGAEAFTPPSKTDNHAIALMQEKRTGDFLWQLGGRIERVTIDAEAIEWEEHHHHEEEEEGDDHGHALLQFESLDFTPFSLSAGTVWDFSADYNASVSVTHAQRAPSASELFSYGPHIGTGTFEVGAVFTLHETDHPHFDYSNDVDEEVSNNIDLSLRKHSGDTGWVVNLFYNQVDNYYYERDTGYSSEDLGTDEHEHEHEHEESGDEHEHDHGVLPVYVFQQDDAALYGLEAQFAWQISNPLKLTLWGDTIRGKLDRGGNLPRTPPARIGSQIEYQHRGWFASLEATHYFDQNKVADLETSTDAYTMVDAALSYTLSSQLSDLTVFLQANNLTDTEARVHTSFLKSRAPLPGRGFSVGLRGTF